MKDSAEEYVADVVDGFNPRRLDILDDMTGAVKVLGNMDVVHSNVNADDCGKCVNNTVYVLIANADMMTNCTALRPPRKLQLRDDQMKKLVAEKFGKKELVCGERNQDSQRFFKWCHHQK